MDAAAQSLVAGASPGLHGRACKACSVAKAKCVPSDGSSSKCLRCNRLGKTCEQTPRLERRKTERQKIGRVSKLEEKLDDLVMLIKGTPQGITAFENGGNSSMAASPASSGIVSSHPQLSKRLNSLRDATPGHDRGSRGLGPYPPQPGYQPEKDPDFVQGNILLDNFRAMMCYFPFVIIPGNVDAQSLWRSKPNLYKAIMVVTSRDENFQHAQAKEILDNMFIGVVQRGEQSIDMLLGTLVIAAWCHFYFYATPRRTSTLYLVLLQLFELGLNRSSSQSHLGIQSLKEQFYPKEISPARTLEERRIALGCFFITSVQASYFQDMDPMQWTPYLEECLEEINQIQEYPTDRVLIKFVRMQLIMEEICSSSWYKGSEFPMSWKVPPKLYIKAKQIELQALKNGLEENWLEETKLRLQYYSVEMTLYSMGLSKAITPSAAYPNDFPRLEILCACLESVRAYFENFFQLPVSAYWEMALPTGWRQVGQAFSILLQLSIFEDPVWDLQYVSEHLNFSAVFCQISNQIEESAKLSNCDNSKYFSRIAAKFRDIKDLFEAKVTACLNSGIDQSQTADSAADIQMSFENLVWDDRWMTDIIGANWPPPPI